MLKHFFRNESLLSVQWHNCTLKSLLISKNKTEDQTILINGLSTECKTALQTLSENSKKKVTLALLPSYMGEFLPQGQSKFSLSNQALFLEKITVKELLNTPIRLKAATRRSKMPPLFFTQKFIEQQQNFFLENGVQIDFLTSTLHAAFFYLLELKDLPVSPYWIFILQEEVLFLYVENNTLKDAFSIQTPIAASLEKQLCQTLYYLRFHRNWTLKDANLIAEPNVEIANTSKKTGIPFNFYTSVSCPKSTLDLTKNLSPSLTCQANNFTSSYAPYFKLFKHSPVTLASCTFFLFLSFYLQILAWSRPIKQLKQKNIQLFEKIQKLTPSVIPPDFSFTSSLSELKELNVLYARKKQQAQKFHQASHPPQLSLLFCWLSDLQRKMIENKARLKINSLQCHAVNGINSPLEVCLSIQVTPNYLWPLLDEEIKKSPSLFQPNTLRTSFQNNDYQASFELHSDLPSFIEEDG